MQRLEWTDKLSIGVERIDNQHRRMVQLANNLVTAMQTDVAEDILDTLFMELREYTQVHFQAEEQYMQDVGYPGLDAHRQTHEALKQQVRDYRQSLKDKKAVPPSDVLRFLKAWLVDHIIYEDMQIGRYVYDLPEIKGRFT